MVAGFEALAALFVVVFEVVFVAHKSKIGFVTVGPLVVKLFFGFVRHKKAFGVETVLSELAFGGEEIREFVEFFHGHHKDQKMILFI